MSRGPKPTREQRQAIDLARPRVLVAASAGTGKTKTLVDRVVQRVTGGTALDRLLVVTFTQKAAEQLKQRLSDAFGASPELRPLRLFLPQAAISTIDAACARLLREHAVVAGIDPAFRLLDEIEDRLLIDEILTARFHRWYRGTPAPETPAGNAWRGVPARGSREHREFLRLVDLCGYQGGREALRDELVRLLELARVHPDPELFLERLAAACVADPPPYREPFARILCAAWRAGRGAYRELVRTGREHFAAKKMEAHERLLAVIEEAPWPTDPETLAGDLPGGLAALQAHFSRAGVATPQGPWGLAFPRLPSGGKTHLDAWNAIAKRYLGPPTPRPAEQPWHWLPADPAAWNAPAAETAPTLQTLLALLRQTLHDHQAAKRTEGRLDFADLELETRRLLEASSADLLARFDEVLVDEFQDVNALQARILTRFEPAGSHFLVGDPKQCIYQFRLSDPSIFRNLFAQAVPARPGEEPPRDAPAVRLYLSRNFRARYPIVRVVNGICGELLPASMLGSPYREQALRFGGDAGLEAAPDGWPAESPDFGQPYPPHAGGRGWAPVELHLLEHGSREDGERAVVREAALIASRLRALIEEGTSIYDAERKAWRPAEYGDVALLLRSPGPTGTILARALRGAGIPVIYGIQSFFERSEVCDFLNLIRVLDNAQDDIALAGLLRAPHGAFDDNDLVRLRLAWPASHALLDAVRAMAAGEASEASGPLERRELLASDAGRALVRKCHRFLAALEGWRARLQGDDLAAALAAAIEESGLREVAASRDGGAERVGNLAQLVALARRYSRERDHSLPGFVRYLRALATTGGGPEPVSLTEGSARAVRILSLHKAKGLEFPIVWVGLLGRRFNLRDLQRRVLTGKHWIGVDHFDPDRYVRTPTVARRVLAWRRREEILAEERRILYVALTRAGERLLLSGTLPSTWEKAQRKLELWRAPDGEQEALGEALLREASCPLDWILGALSRRGLLEPPAAPDAATRPDPALQILHHPAVPPAESAPLPPTAPPSATAHPAPPARAAARTPVPEETGAGSPPTAPAPAPTTRFAALADRLARPYLHPPATRWRGKYAVTEIKRLADLDREEEARAVGTAAWDQTPAHPGEPDAGAPARRLAARGAGGAGEPGDADPARQSGLWLHALLETWDFGTDDGSPEAVLRHATEQARRGHLPAEWISAARVAPIVAFLASPWAAEMRAAGARLEREALFTLRVHPPDLCSLWPAISELPDEEWVLLEGRIDALWPRTERHWIVLDFKSDRVATEAEARARATAYAPQIRLYREAVARLWPAERVECQLYFLRPGLAIPVAEE